MARSVLLVFVAALSWLSIASAAELAPQKILQGRAELSVPAAFTRMTDEMKRIKYPTGNPPQDVLTDENGTVNVAASVRPMAAAKLSDMVASIAETVGRVRTISTWHSKGTRVINGREFGYLEFTSPTIDTEVYNYIYFTFEGGDLIMFTVNSTIKELPAWKNTLHAVVDSTRIVAKP